MKKSMDWLFFSLIYNCIYFRYVFFCLQWIKTLVYVPSAPAGAESRYTPMFPRLFVCLFTKQLIGGIIIQSTQETIENVDKFYRNIGLKYNKEWISIIDK